MTSVPARRTMWSVRNPRVYGTFVVIAATLIGAAWLYGYRSSESLQYIDRNGHRFHPTDVVSTQPWWSVYATVGLIFVGVGIVLWLVPGSGRAIERTSERLIAPRPMELDRRRD